MGRDDLLSQTESLHSLFLKMDTRIGRSKKVRVYSSYPIRRVIPSLTWLHVPLVG